MGDLYAFYWRQIFALESVFVNAQHLYNSHHHGEKNLIKLSMKCENYMKDRKYLNEKPVLKENLSSGFPTK